MDSTKDIWGQTILRTIVVAGSGMLLGFILYQSSIFMPTMRAFQFAMSSLTAGITYAALKSSTPRNGFAALFIWYVILTGLVEEFNSWLLILNLVYLAGIAAAIFVYDFFVQKPFLQYVFRRIVVAAGCTAIANGLIIVVLALVSFRTTFAHPTSMLLHFYQNIQLGTLIGLGIGIGVEIAEYLTTKVAENKMDSVHIKHTS